ncbi:hypothetical protein TNCV_3973871 [Trichonephila clavipes]|nr:hypothetical protein TNCV_3973871 [Trichonephila clavipes]
MHFYVHPLSACGCGNPAVLERRLYKLLNLLAWQGRDNFFNHMTNFTIPSPETKDESMRFENRMTAKVDSDGVRELLDSHNQMLTMDELIEMHEKEQNIEEESSDLGQLNDRVTVVNLTEGHD